MNPETYVPGAVCIVLHALLNGKMKNLVSPLARLIPLGVASMALQLLTFGKLKGLCIPLGTKKKVVLDHCKLVL